MSQTAIPLQFEQYMQNQISAGKAPNMNEMVFAYIPNLDLEQSIDRAQGLPDVAKWVYQQDVDQVGKVGDNALAYSVVIAGNVAEFKFNAIYLRDKNVPNSCGMVVHKPDETKENGSSVTKSLLQEYIGAAQVVGIDVDAGTWQIDYQARLKGIEEDHRLACLDTYGHTAFVDGFDVTQQADVTKYLISPGVVYVEGLRGVLTNEIVQTIATKPTGIYLDIYRAGTSTSKWENILEVRVSDVLLADYVNDGVQHYVAKVAGINADGSVVDARVKGGLAEHEMVSQFMPYTSSRKYKCGEICTIENDGETSYWQWYSNIESLRGKSPLDLANRHEDWTDNTKPFYWIPYTGDQVGMPFFWVDTTPPEWAILEINVDLPVAVYWRLARCYPHLITGSIINTGEIRGEFLRVLDQGRGIDVNRQINTYQKGTVVAGNDNDDIANTSIQSINTHREELGWEPADLTGVGMDVDLINWVNGLSYDRNFNPELAKWMGSTRSRNVARPMVIAI